MQQRLFMTLLDSLFNFCMSCIVGRTKRIETSSDLWLNGTGFQTRQDKFVYFAVTTTK